MNFDRPLKVNYRDQFYKIRLLSGSDNSCSEDELDESDDDEGTIVTTEDGNFIWVLAMLKRKQGAKPNPPGRVRPHTR